MAKEKRELPITSAFGVVFRRIRKRASFASPPMSELGERMFESLIAASLAKCVDFNVAVNRARKQTDEEFAFVSALRGVCEDLIWLAYISKMPGKSQQELTKLLITETISNGLEVQQAFFSANNPFQPVLSALTTDREDGSFEKSSASKAMTSFWLAEKKIKRRPTVKEMASDVGLNFTYDYIYFVSSNFVHFNPQALLRMGWGDLENPFRFSTSHMSAYYKALASFYGAILFIGYHSAFSARFRSSCETEVAMLFDLIENVQRWPEVITFEEMNESTPWYLLTHAMGRALAEKGAPRGILAEVRGLGDRLKPR